MKFSETPLEGVFLIEPEMKADERGAFARTFCAEEFGDHGLVTFFPQHSVSITYLKGTVRGMHFQKPPKRETKLVRCIQGSVFDVVVDLRPDSKSYLKWNGFELSAGNRLSLYVPAGFAHGFQTLDDNTEVFYQISEFFEPSLASGVRYDDPLIQIQWPLPVSVINERDREWALIGTREAKK